MDKLHKPKQDYVPTAVPATDSSMLVRRTKFVVRDFDGSKVFEGPAIIEEDNRTHQTTVVMSTLMAFSMMEELRKHFFIGSEEEPVEDETDSSTSEKNDGETVTDKLMGLDGGENHVRRNSENDIAASIDSIVTDDTISPFEQIRNITNIFKSSKGD